MSDDHAHSVRNLQHLSINLFRETQKFEKPSRDQARKPLRDDYADHAAMLLDQLAIALATQPGPDEQRLRIETLRSGKLVEVATMEPAKGGRAKATKVPAALEVAEIAILRTERRDDRTERALLFVPDQAQDHLRERLRQYGRDPGNQVRPDLDRFEVIGALLAVRPERLFTGPVDLADPQIVWWELWVLGDRRRAAQVAAHARAAEFDVHADRLEFPDTIVVFVHGTAAAIAAFAARIPGAVAEIRQATGTIEPFLDRREGRVGQHEFVDELAGRLVAPPTEAPTVCVLDTGVSATHPLLRPGLRGAYAYDAAWGTDDHHPWGGHGTGLVGLALYGDLEPLMNGGAPVHLTHGAESMKLLPPRGFAPTAPPSWGVVTQGAVAFTEIERPGILRSFCLATSAKFFPPSRPSTWSGALDQIAAGSMKGEVADNTPALQRPKRLLLVATGNVADGPRAEVELLQPLEDPAQSWNALTVGGFTRKDTPPLPPPVMTAVVPANHRSPYSMGSNTLPDDLTPIKPEVLFEAGNMLADPAGYCEWHQSVALLSTGSDLAQEPLTPIWATSAAVGMAGHFTGQLQAALPALWPETHRALIVDSAAWTQPMRARLVSKGAHWKGGKQATAALRQQILREVGYGVPDLERAILSARNDVTLIAEAEIQPYGLGSDKRSGIFNEMHFYQLPWPREALQSLADEVVTMKVTLSYFIEPNLTGKAATRPDTYRSYGLRFVMKGRAESDKRFRARVNATQTKDDTPAGKETSRWLLGPKAIHAGSLHCDLWRGRAVELAGHDGIAIFPVGGWWKAHTGQRRMQDKARYALTISISAPGQAINLHAEVMARIEAYAAEIAAAEVPAT